MRLQGWLIMLTAMIMFLSLLGLPVGLDPILKGVGVNITSSNAQLVSADIESSSFWAKLFGGTSGILIIIGAGAVLTIGLLARGYDPSLIIIPFIVLVGTLYIGTFWAIISLVKDYEQIWMTSIVGIIFASLAVGFGVACVSYFAGR